MSPSEGWRRLDRRMLLVHPLMELWRFVVPLVLVFLIGGTRQGDGTGHWHLLVVAIPIALGLLRYVSTTYRITRGQIELRHGILGRRIVIARLDKVRTVDVTAHPLHRLLGLAKVEVGTGTARKRGEDKLVLDALDAESAQAMRLDLLARAHTTGATEAPLPPPRHVLLRLNPAWIRYAPLTTTGLTIAAAAVGTASRFVGDSIGRFLDQHRVGAGWPVWLLVTIVLVLALVSVSGSAMVGYLLTYFGFELSHDHAGLQLQRGLLTRRDTSVDEDRIRGVEIHQPLGLRLAGAGRLGVIVTGLSRGERGSTTLVPPAPLSVVRAVAGQVLEAPVGSDLVRHGRYATRRRLLRAAYPGLLLSVAALLWLPMWGLAVALLLLAAALPLGWDRAARLGHAVTPAYLVVRQGSLNGRQDVLTRTGVIGWNLRESLFQRRVGLATLTATTAAGRQRYHALDIPVTDAIAVADEVTPDLLTPYLA